MSPTMTEGGIAGWKKSNGESYSAGDVVLEIVSHIWFSIVADVSRKRIKRLLMLKLKMTELWRRS